MGRGAASSSAPGRAGRSAVARQGFARRRSARLCHGARPPPPMAPCHVTRSSEDPGRRVAAAESRRARAAPLAPPQGTARSAHRDIAACASADDGDRGRTSTSISRTAVACVQRCGRRLPQHGALPACCVPPAHGNLAPLEVGTGVRPQRQSGARGCGEADAGRWAVSRWRRTAAVPRAPSSGPSPTQAAASSSLHTQLTLSPPPTHLLTTSHTTHTQHVQVLCPRRRGRV
jgi:hypothetical protein